MDDGNALNLAEAQEVGVAADDVVGAAGNRALEELVVRRIPTHADHHIWTDEHGTTPKSLHDRPALTRRDTKLSQDLGARGDHLDLGHDRFGDEQDELLGAPGVVNACREALGARERAPQEDLRVKNDSGRGQREPPRR